MYSEALKECVLKEIKGIKTKNQKNGKVEKKNEKKSLPDPLEAANSCSISLLIISKLPENSCFTKSDAFSI